MVRQIWPISRNLTDRDLETLYAYPTPNKWVAANFVTSVDGAVKLKGTSAALSNLVDQQVFQLSSGLADVVLLGAGTAIAENYRGIRPDQRVSELRRRHGLTLVPRIAVLSSGRSLPPDAPVLAEPVTPSIIITCRSSPSAIRRAWASRNVEVLVAGEDSVDLATAVSMLVERGMTRISYEGGLRLFRSLLIADQIDELRLTVSPIVIPQPTERFDLSALTAPNPARLASVLTADDVLLLRYLCGEG